MIQYLRGTADYGLTLEADDLQQIYWWIDAAFAVHQDMRSHTGQHMSLGKGAVYSSSSKQKLNTRSSTEAELVGLNDGMTQILWTGNFLNAQGYDVGEGIVFQHKSWQIMEKCPQGSAHVI